MTVTGVGNEPVLGIPEKETTSWMVSGGHSNSFPAYRTSKYLSFRKP